ncbi:MAG: prepilin-type cleavage/methylation domain-containing protein [Polyangiaceae bacterium]|nr:prepilin-type cleavage/methylation domain-containing protein [Polyangiaceae bacterium]
MGRGISRRRRSQGVTVFEVIIAVTLIALFSGALLLGVGFRRSSEVRSAASLVLVGVRLGMTRANATGRPVRMVFDLDQHRIGLEETLQPRMLRTKSDEDGAAAGAEPANELEAAAREEAERILKGPQEKRPRFAPVAKFGGDEGAGGTRALGTHVRLRSVQTEHDPEPLTEGRAYLYIWPRGGTEEAAVQISDDEGGEGLTVRISALTGRGRIERGRVSLPEPRGDEDDWSERDEE